VRIRRRHVIATILLLLLGGAFYFYFLHRVQRTQQADGWRLRFSYQPFHCQVCLGHVEEMTYHGTPVNPPHWAWNSNDDLGTPRVIIQTPMGVYEAWKGVSVWRLGHAGALMIEDSDESVSAEEMTQGWYDAKIAGDRFTYGPFKRKKNTPIGWCLLSTTNASRWIAPEKIHAASW